VSLSSKDTRTASAARPLLGSAYALLSAVAISLTLVLVRITYETGADALAVNTSRTIAFVAFLYAYLRVSGGPTTMPTKPRVTTWILGALMCVELYGLFAAVQFISVSLAALIFYTYPMLILLITRMTAGERITPPRIAAMATALAGLALVLQAQGETPDWRGLAWAVAATIAFAGVVILSERTLRGRDSRVVTLHMILAAAAILVGASAIFWPLHWPREPGGWLAMAAATVTFAIATMSLFAAVKAIGPLRTAVIDNTAPVWAIGFAMLLLDESLTPLQWLGAALVIGAVAVMQFTLRRRSHATGTD
jgi:drug/metabolite transporter (DMT)-like permease